MTKSNKILIGLLIVQFGFILAAKVATRSHKATPPRALFPGLSADQIISIEVTDNEKKTARLEKQGKQWVLASADGYPADGAKVSEFVGKLPALTSNDVVASKPTFFHSLEVADDSFQRNVTLKTADKSYHFLLGSSPGIKSAHFRFQGENDVYVVRGISSWDIGASATHWVKNEYFKFNKDEVTGVTLENTHGTLTFQETPENTWQVSPLPADTTPDKINAPVVQSFINSATNVFLQEPIGKVVKAEYGLNTPQARLSVTTPNGTQTLLIGGKFANKEGAHYYAKASHSEFVALVGAWAAEQFVNKKAADFVKNDTAPSAARGASGLPDLSELAAE